MWKIVIALFGWLGAHLFDIIKWFGPAIARLIGKWWVLAGLSLFAISTWAMSDWNNICDSVATYIDLCANLIESLNFDTGVEWIDGFIGFLALDSFVGYLVLFLAFFLPLFSVVVIGVFISIVGFALKLIVYKITTSATRDFSK